MAKKKKQAKKQFNFRRLRTFLLIVLAFGLIIGLIYQHNPQRFQKSYDRVKEFFSQSKKSTDTLSFPKPATPPKTPKEKKPAASTTKPTAQQPPKTSTPTAFDIRKIKGLDIPAPLKDRSEQLISHTGYTVSYNKDWKVANWVGYELTRPETSGEEKRTNKFVADPKVKGASATDADYRGSGYDRGHLAPAADMAWSAPAMKESFYFSNMTPQAPNLNRGIWKSLEDKVRKWAGRDSAIIVICGPVINDTRKTIGKNKVLVPAMFYKVILSPYGKTPKAIGFLFKNEGSLQTLDTFAVPVDRIEQLTGIDFFYQLPDTLESRIEGSFQLNQWF